MRKSVATGIAVVATCIAVISIFCGGVLALAWWDFRTHTYQIVADVMLDEDTAVLAVARNALDLHGLDSSRYKPLKFSHGSVVGRNELNPNRVSTYWTPAAVGEKYGWGVSLERTESGVECGVTRMK